MDESVHETLLYFPGGVASLDPDQGYTWRDGMIYALSLESGRLVWELADSGIPFVVNQQHLWTTEFKHDQSNTLIVRAFQLQKPDLSWKTEIQLSQDFDPQDAGRFCLHPDLLNDKVQLCWQGLKHYHGGAPIQQHDAAEPAYETGAVQLELDTKSVSQQPPPPEAHPPAGPSQAIAVRIAGSLRSVPWEYRNQWWFLSRESTDKNRQAVYLQSDSSDRRQKLIETPETADLPAPVVSKSGDIICLADPSQGEKFILIETSSAEQVASMSLRGDVDDISRIRSDLYVKSQITKPVIVAYSLPTGDLRWQWKFPDFTSMESAKPPPLPM